MRSILQKTKSNSVLLVGSIPKIKKIGSVFSTTRHTSREAGAKLALATYLAVVSQQQNILGLIIDYKSKRLAFTTFPITLAKVELIY